MNSCSNIEVESNMRIPFGPLAAKVSMARAVICLVVGPLAVTLLPAALMTPTVGRAQEQAAAPAPVNFSKEIAPILLKSCQGCHGQSEPKGDFQLYTYTLLMKPGASTSPSVTAGKLDESELWRLVSSQDKAERMP